MSDSVVIDGKQYSQAYLDERLDKTRLDHAVWTCIHHPNLRWHGKNMFGRSIFFAGDIRPDECTPECHCPGTDLVILPLGSDNGRFSDWME